MNPILELKKSRIQFIEEKFRDYGADYAYRFFNQRKKFNLIANQVFL